MSASAIPYHLRQNKAIERNLFIELLRRIGFARNISEYRYIGFGGPFLEDFKLIHNALRITDMHSIESDENTFLRQCFNQPVNLIDLHHCSSTDFFDKWTGEDQNNIVWLDYTAPSELGTQLIEARGVASKLNEFDILKLTLNASASTLGYGDQPTAARLKLRLKRLTERVGEYAPPSLSIKAIQTRNYPDTLQACIQNALSSLSARAMNLAFHPVASFKYSDGGHTMLTVSGVMLKAGDEASIKFLKDTRLEHWEFSNLNWSSPIEISVPNLSIKERLRIEEALPLPEEEEEENVADRLYAKLGYWPCNPRNPVLLENYAKLYRAFPYFSKVNPT